MSERGSTIERFLTEKHGNLETVIPALVSELGQNKAAIRLGVNQSWVSRWLRDNGYVQRIQYVKSEEVKNV